MDTLRCLFIIALHQIQINFFRHKRDHWSRAFADLCQRRVQRHVSVDLILLHTLCPEALPAAAHIPVAHLVYEVVQDSGGLRDAVVLQIIIHFLDCGV